MKRSKPKSPETDTNAVIMQLNSNVNKLSNDMKFMRQQLRVLELDSHNFSFYTCHEKSLRSKSLFLDGQASSSKASSSNAPQGRFLYIMVESEATEVKHSFREQIAKKLSGLGWVIVILRSVMSYITRRILHNYYHLSLPSSSKNSDSAYSEIYQPITLNLNRLVSLSTLSF